MTPPQLNPAVNTDRNLLFGILAFQNALLTREALVAGTLDPSAQDTANAE
jgi:hypothetical protein